jgi:hypothetical protein
MNIQHQWRKGNHECMGGEQNTKKKHLSPSQLGQKLGVMVPLDCTKLGHCTSSRQAKNLTKTFTLEIVSVYLGKRKKKKQLQ